MSNDSDDLRICLATSGDNIKLWHSKSFLLNQQFTPHHGNVSSLSWSYDNNVLASTSTTAQDKICLTYVNANNHTVTVDGSNGVQCASFSSDNRFIAGGNANGIVNVWDIKTGRIRKTFDKPCHKAMVTAVEFGFRDSSIASGSSCGEVILYNTATGQGFSPLQTPSKQAIRQMQFSQFRRSLLGAACDDGILYLWDTNTKLLLRRFDSEAGAHRAPCTGLVFSPCNQMLLVSVGLDKNIVCYDVVSNKVIKSMTNDDPLTSVDLLDDGSTLAVGSSRGRVHIYDIRVTTVPLHTLVAHRSAVSRVCFQRNPAVFKKTGSGTALQTGGRAVHSGTKLNNNNIKITSAAMTTSDVPPKPQTSSRQATVLEDENRSSYVMESHGAKAASGAVEATSFNDLFSPARDVGSTSEDVSSRISLEKANGNFADHFADGVFSPLADVSGSRGEMPTNRSGSGNEIFSPSVYYTAVAANPSRKVDEDRRDFIPELIKDMPATAQVQFKSDVNEDKLVERSLNGVAKRMSASVSDLAERCANRVCFDAPSPQRSMESSSVTTSYSPVASRLSKQSTRCYSTDDIELNSTSEIDRHLLPPSNTVLPSRTNTASSSAKVSWSSSEFTRMSLQTNTVSDRNNELNGCGKVESFEGASGDSQATLHPYLIELVRSTVREEVEECEERLRRSLLHLHADMLKQFHTHQLQMHAMLKEYSVNPSLLAEIERLKVENERLKKNY